MTDDFNAYHKWLGIPPEQQPPNHYDLLGLPLFEQDEEVIEAAADRQMRHLHSYQSGPRAHISQRLLNEVADASACLLDQNAKRKYDAGLSTERRLDRFMPPPPIAPPPPENNSSRNAPDLERGPTEFETHSSAKFAGIVIRDPARPNKSAKPVKEKKARKVMRPANLAFMIIIGLSGFMLLGLLVVWFWPTRNPAQQTATIRFAWTPEELRHVNVLINDQPVLPLSLQRAEYVVPAGRISVSATRPFYKPIQKTFELEPNSSRNIFAGWLPNASVRLLWPKAGRQNASVMLDDQPIPEGAIIRADDRGVDIAVDPGPHQIVVQRRGFAPQQEQISLAPGARHTVRVSFAEVSTLRATDLIKAIDIPRHAIGGPWRKASGKLTVDSLSFPACVAPLEPGREFRLLVEFERKSGKGGLAISLSGPSAKKGNAIFAIGGSRFSNNRRQLFELKRQQSSDIATLNRAPQTSWRATSPSAVVAALPTSPLLDGCVVLQCGPGEFEIHRMQILDNQSSLPRHVDLARTVTFGGHSYQRINRQLSWREAAAVCESKGGYLCCPETQAEFQFLRTNLMMNRQTWFGGTDELVEGQWQWLSRQKWDWSHWAPKKPTSHAELPYQHLAASGSSGQWTDLPEGKRHYFICEWDAAPKPSKPSSPRAAKLATMLPSLGYESLGRPQEYQDHAYLLINSPQTWHVAKTVCEKLGGRLCTLESPTEYLFVRDNLLPKSSIWIGASNNRDDGIWRWLTGQSFTYDRWNQRVKIRDADLAKYLEMLGKQDAMQTGHWLAQNGSKRRAFVCEWETTDVPLLNRLAERKNRRKLPIGDRAAIQSRLRVEIQRQLSLGRSKSELAAEWINTATKESDDLKTVALLEEVAMLSVKAHLPALAMLAIDHLEARFELNDADQRRFDVLRSAASVRIETPTELQEVLDACREFCIRCDDVAMLGEVQKLYDRLPKAAGLSKDERLLAAMNRDREYLREVARIADAAAKKRIELKVDKDSPAANLAVGLQLALVRGDWTKALPHLAKSNKKVIAKHAASLVDDADNYDAQLGLGDAIWAFAAGSSTGNRYNPAAAIGRTAASYWYRKAIGRASGAELKRIVERIGPRPPQGAPPMAAAFPMHGFEDGFWLRPETAPNPGRVHALAKGFAEIAGAVDMPYPVQPVSEFVHELEMQMLAPAGWLEFDYHRKEGGRIKVYWSSEFQTFRYELVRYSPRFPEIKTFPGGRPNNTINLTLYSRPGLQKLFVNGQEVARTGRAGEDLRLRIKSGSKCRAQIRRCIVRPWTDADYLAVGLKAPELKSFASGKTAHVVLSRQAKLPTAPKLRQPQPFVIASTGTAMRWLPDGKYTRVKKSNSATSEIVLSRGFWIGQYELTQREWAAVTKTNPARTRGSAWLPVDGVSYSDAVAYCQLLTELERKEGRIPDRYCYRLPTEAEWEYACRAGANDLHNVPPTEFWNGNTAFQLSEIGLSQPNPWELYDMLGNASEWVLDAYSELPETPKARLVDPFLQPLPGSTAFCVRGGVWWRFGRDCNTRTRERREPHAARSRGFRIALAPVLQQPR